MRCSFVGALFLAAFVGSGYALPVENKKDLQDVDLVSVIIRDASDDGTSLVSDAGLWKKTTEILLV